jgi:hypothetical protein
MSALGQKQTLQSGRPVSALPPKADIVPFGMPIAVTSLIGIIDRVI